MCLAKIHVLESDDGCVYRVVIHFSIPTGDNAIGRSWKDCALASGMTGVTVLEVGSAPGNITQAEYDSIIAGDTVEIVRMINPGLDPSVAAVEALADIYIAEWKKHAQRVLKYYGYEIGGE